MAMEIIRGRPTARGVTELMYVGDVEQLEQATDDCAPTPFRIAMGVLGVLVLNERAKSAAPAPFTGLAAYYMLYRAVIG